MSNELEVMNEAKTAIASLTNSDTMLYSSFRGDTREGKLQVIAAITNATPLNEHLDEVINLVNFVAQAVKIQDDKDPEVQNDAVRCYLIDSEGNSYSATSNGILGSLRDFTAILGEPSTWAEPLPIRVEEKRARSGRRFFQIVLA